VLNLKNLSPKQIALRLSVVIGIFICLSGTLVWVLFHPFNFLFSLFIFLSSFLASYFVFLWGIMQFIERKVRLVYKIIHNSKIGLKKEGIQLNKKEDIFGKINEAVIEWDKKNRDEIERLTDQEKFRKEFMGNVSHELRTPLFSIQGYVLTLLEGGLEDKKINRSFLMKAEKSILRMIEMVDDLDEISRLESNKMQLNYQKFNLVEVAEEVKDSIQYKSKKKNISIVLKNNTKPVWVYADLAKIAQVFSNLIINSINYGKKDGICKIKFYDMDENILVEVSDNGPGISKLHLPRLFERFYRVDKGRSRKEGGSGLGLAIVKHIIESHNQTINVRSEEGKGSVFSFTLKKA